MGLILKGGNIVSDKKTYKADIKIDCGKILEIGKDLKSDGCEVIDVSERFIIPGAIDTHTHFDLDTGSTKTADDFNSGTKAAIVGGTTTILDFATQTKGKTLKEGLNEWHLKANNKCYCDYGFHMAITDWNDSVCDEMQDMINSGVSSFKLYMAYKGALQVNDDVIYKALKRSKELGAVIGFHCENGDIIQELVKENLEKGNTSPKYHCISRPDILEVEATSRLLKIAEITNSKPYIVHLSSKEALKEVQNARSRGVEVIVETCPQYLLLNSNLYDLEGFEGAKYVMSPPLRAKSDNEAVWNAIANNEIDTIGTDHCSFNYKGQKELGLNDFSKIPNGSPGVEHRVGLLYTYGVCEGKISINKMVELISTKPAKIFGLYPQKGVIEVGSDADIVVLNPKKQNVIGKENQIQNVDYTPYEGYKMNCEMEYVYLRGNLTVSNGEIATNVLAGKYLKRKSSL